MTAVDLGRTLVIANPAAHSGRGAEAAALLGRFLDAYGSLTRGHELRLTTAPGDATRWARDAGDYDTILVLGGDGIVHEAVCGLMALPRHDRPALGVLPEGSGNDYARTLGIRRNDVEAAMRQLVQGTRASLDVGVANGVPFVETLSFGIDAAIALDTTARRARGTSEQGEGLYVSSAFDTVTRAAHPVLARFSFDGGPEREQQTLIFAVQVGPTYGGGWRICPEASPTDGLLDVCHNVQVPGVARLLALFALARTGLHARTSAVEMLRVRHLSASFPEGVPPCQVDGERLSATAYEVDSLPGALEVLVPGAFGR